MSGFKSLNDELENILKDLHKMIDNSMSRGHWQHVQNYKLIMAKIRKLCYDDSATK
jgi:hypothetical protein